MDKNTIQDIVKALEFYADEYNYSPDVSEPWELANIDCDEGRKARDVLELIKNQDGTKWQVFKISTGEPVREFDTEDAADNYKIYINNIKGVYDVRKIFETVCIENCTSCTDTECIFHEINRGTVEYKKWARESRRKIEAMNNYKELNK